MCPLASIPGLTPTFDLNLTHRKEGELEGARPIYIARAWTIISRDACRGDVTSYKQYIFYMAILSRAREACRGDVTSYKQYIFYMAYRTPRQA